MEEALSRWRHLGSEEGAAVVERAWELSRTRRWEGLGGLVVTPEMQGSISALASLMTLHVGLRALADVTSILVAPATVTKAVSQRLGGGLVGESRACVLGESLLHGPVRLAWERIEDDRRSGLGSVVIHEFAHKIDMADGLGSGVPPIGDRHKAREFEEVILRSLDQVRQSDLPVPLTAYAGTSPAELFAVSSEKFFLTPDALNEGFPDLFTALMGYYGQRPVVAPSG